MTIPPPNLEPETAAQRRARHLATCQRLIALGMTVARATAAQAERDAAALQGVVPGTSEAHRVFVRMAKSVREIAALESMIAAAEATSRKIAAESAARPKPPAAPKSPAPSRQATLAEALHRLAEAHANPRSLHQTIEDTVEETLATHPNDPLPIHFARACKTLKLKPDFTGFPDRLIDDLHPRNT